MRHPEHIEQRLPLVNETWMPLLLHRDRHIHLRDQMLTLDTALSRIYLTPRHNKSRAGGLFAITYPESRFLSAAESAARHFLLCVTPTIPEPDIWNRYPSLEPMVEGHANINDHWANSLTAAQFFWMDQTFLDPPFAYPFTAHTKFSPIRRRYREAPSK